MKYTLKNPIKIAPDLKKSFEELLQLNQLVIDKISEIDLLIRCEFTHQFSLIVERGEFDDLTASCQEYISKLDRKLDAFQQERTMLVAFLADYKNVVINMEKYYEREEASLNKLDKAIE